VTERKPADLDAWLAALDHPRKAEVALLVAIALAARPGITGHIKWNAPSFLYAGDDRVTLGLRPNGVLQIVFHRGAKVKDAAGFTFADDSGLIKMVARDRGVVTLAEGEVAAKADALGRLIARWVEAAK
jgi:hypothetical protein